MMPGVAKCSANWKDKRAIDSGNAQSFWTKADVTAGEGRS